MNFETIKDSIIIYGGKILIAIVFLIIAHIVVKKVLSLLKDGFKKRKLDPSLNSFLLSLIKALLYVIVIISVAAIMGIQTASFVTILGAASLAVGLALQGSLSNFAGGGAYTFT